MRARRSRTAASSSREARRVFARHGESEYSVRGAAERRRRRSPVGLTAGRRRAGARARRGAARRAARPLRHERARARPRRPPTLALARPRRPAPRRCRELNDPLYGPFEGGLARGLPRVGEQRVLVRAPGHGRREPARDRRALRARLPDRARPARGDDPRRRALAAGRVPARRAGRASSPARGCRSSEYATAYPFTAEELERAVGVLEALACRADLVTLREHCRRGRPRADRRAHPPRTS